MRSLSVMGAVVLLAVPACGSSRTGTNSPADGGAGGAAGAAGASSDGAAGGGAAGAAGAAGSTSAGCSAEPIAPNTTETIQIQHEGVQRSYILHVPKGYDGSKPVPLVLNFHGYGSNALQQELFSGMNATSDADGARASTPSASTPRACPTAAT